MKRSREEIEKRVSSFKQGLKRSGAKLTYQRLAIFQELAKSAEHPDAYTLFRSIRREIPTLSLDTVYRTLWLFLDLGLISTLGPSRENTRFDANMRSHHHFVCLQCGRTRDFYSKRFDDLKAPAAARSMGQIQTTRVEARGVCLQCLGKKASSSKEMKIREKNHG